MPLVDNPNETIVHDVDRCGSCGADLTGAPIGRVERRQVTDITAPPPPYVTEYRILTRTCPCCASAQAGATPTAWGPRPVRARGARRGRGADLRALPARRPGGRAVGDPGRDSGSRSGSSPVSAAGPPACSNRRSCPGCGTCSGGGGAARRRDPRPRRQEPGLRAHRRDRVADRDAHRRPLEGRHRQRRGPARLRRHHRARRLRRLHPPHRRPARLVRRPPPARSGRATTAPTPTSRCGRRPWPTCSVDAHHHAQDARAPAQDRIDSGPADRSAAALPGRLHRRHPRQRQPQPGPWPATPPRSPGASATTRT